MVDKREENGVVALKQADQFGSVLKPNKSNEFRRLADNPSANNSLKTFASFDSSRLWSLAYRSTHISRGKNWLN